MGFEVRISQEEYESEVISLAEDVIDWEDPEQGKYGFNISDGVTQALDSHRWLGEHSLETNVQILVHSSNAPTCRRLENGMISGLDWREGWYNEKWNRVVWAMAREVMGYDIEDAVEELKEGH